MTLKTFAAGLAVFCALGAPASVAACNISDAQLEAAILEKSELRDPRNRYQIRSISGSTTNNGATPMTRSFAISWKSQLADGRQPDITVEGCAK